MTSGVLLVVLGSALAGGAISCRQQREPVWPVLLPALLAAGPVGSGRHTWSQDR